MDSRISVMEHGLTQLTALMNQVLTQTSQPKPSAPTPHTQQRPNKDLVTPETTSHNHTNKDKVAKPSMEGSKPKDPTKGDSGVS
jgi:hypothetical protein